jgi:misacylated tRNA(Ala) deacylase
MLKIIDPKMHSAEHLLNQAMVRGLGCDRCFSAHINRKKSKCDYHFDRPLSNLEVTQIQGEVNRVIGQNYPVVIEQVSRAAAQKEFNLSRVSEQENLSEFRVVRMGDYDACPCSGPHVQSTGEIGVFAISSSGYENNVLRIRFKLS